MTIDIEKIREYREKMNDRILSEDSISIKRFINLDHNVYSTGAIEAKNKELMGLVASTVLRCNDCIFYHIDRAIAEGASSDELIETLNIALIVGGSIVIPHLRFAFETIDAIVSEST